MTETNPFGGGFDMNALLEQAQAMQQQMVSAQERLAEAEIEGTVADGLVTVTVDGTGEMRGVKIRANSFDPSDTEDLEDLIIAAYRDARSKADAAAAEAFGPLAGGLGALGGEGGLPGLGGTPGGPAGAGETDSDLGGGEPGGSRSLGF
jgi:DNA-binding YbaB/EbfC family protein